LFIYLDRQTDRQTDIRLTASFPAERR